MLDLNAPHVIALLVSIIGGFSSLVYWLVRMAFKRQGEITDRYFTHLERKDQEQQENIRVFGDSMEKFGRAMDEQTSLLKQMQRDQEGHKCRYDGGGRA